LVFENYAYFFAENWEKIDENCDHNIDPWTMEKMLTGVGKKGLPVFKLKPALRAIC
jgi:hypothetical protein